MGVTARTCCRFCALFVAVCGGLVPAGIRGDERARLPATADVWLSDAVPQERNTNSGKCSRLKLKSIQELALIRFDASAAAGREVLGATLFLRRVSDDKLRYLRVSTVSQDWVEGESPGGYGPPTGATFLFADARPDSLRPWAWPGSSLADVIMSSGNSLGCWGERRELDDGWLSVELTPDLVYAMVARDTDGLAVMDGGNPANHNNFIHSVQSRGSEPYIQVRLGGALEDPPPAPVVAAAPASERSHLTSGAIRVEIEPAPGVFCWRVWLDGERVERWRVKRPARRGPTVFYLEDLTPAEKHALKVVAVSRGGLSSEPAELRVTSSPALRAEVRLGEIAPPEKSEARPVRDGVLQAWALPGLVKISPLRPTVMCDDLSPGADPARASAQANAVWDGKQITLFGARGEYVSYQLCIENLGREPMKEVVVRAEALDHPQGGAVSRFDIELYQNWYAQNGKGQWQPAYCLPLEHGAGFAIPDPFRGLDKQQNQTVYVDVYVPRDARPGEYRGAVSIEALGTHRVRLPVALTVLDFVLPDRLSFWPELNAYHLPPHPYEAYRLVHQHRCVLNCMGWPQPRVTGSGRRMQVHWEEYDRRVGPLLTGEAFVGNRRKGMPVECMYLPFGDNWPMPLDRRTYDYPHYWPRQGDPIDDIVTHYLKAPYIAHGLSQDYKDGFHAVQRQFIEHFRRRGYDKTEMQCFYGNKVTHRIEYGAEMWWTTDEPYFWDDWLALQFFTRLWAVGRGDADRRRWVARADISRPQWQGRVLKGVVDVAYYGAGGFSTPAMVRRCRTLAQETGVRVRSYGGASPDHASNTQNVVALLRNWADGAEAFLPWQTLGGKASLDTIDKGIGGAALLVPGDRFRIPVVADMRLKAFRDGQQLIEYAVLLAERRGLSREQVKAMLHEAVPLKAQVRGGVDNADAMRFGSLSAWHISELRRRVAEWIVESDRPRGGPKTDRTSLFRDGAEAASASGGRGKTHSAGAAREADHQVLTMPPPRAEWGARP